MLSDVSLQRSLNEINQQYTRLLDALSALRALSDIDTGHPDEDLLLQRAVQILLEYQSVQFSAIFLCDDAVLHFKAGLVLGKGQRMQGPNTRLYDLFSAAVSEPATRLVQCATEAALVSTPGLDLGVLFGQGISSGQAPVPDGLQTCSRGRTLCVPINDGTEVLGVLVAYYPEMESRFEAHQHMLVLYSNFLGQILANRRRTHSMEDLIQQRTRQLEQALADSQQLRQRFEELSIKDELTGLHNRRFFFPAASSALANCIRHTTPFSVMIIDLDHFKQVNDNYGHAFGDDTLVQTAHTIAAQSREGDIIARFGGEEFVIAMPDCNQAGAIQLADRILNTLRGQTVVSGEHQARVTASIGIACMGTALDPRTDATQVETAETESCNLDGLLQQADQALYSSKDNGRDQYRLFAAD